MNRFAATAAVLAGGRSSRMGQDKALLQMGGRPLLQIVVETLQEWFAEVLVVTNHAERYPFLSVPIIADREPGLGPLAGIEAALTAASFPRVYIAACDMPFLNREVIAHFLAGAEDMDAVVAQIKGEWEPLYAVYHRRCLPAVRETLDAGNRRVVGFFQRVRVRAVGADELSPLADVQRLFFNMNTPDDWSAAQRLLGDGHAAGRADDTEY